MVGLYILLVILVIVILAIASPLYGKLGDVIIGFFKNLFSGDDSK